MSEESPKENRAQPSNLPLFANGECNQGRSIPGEVVLATGLQSGRPRIFLLEIVKQWTIRTKKQRYTL